MLEDLVERAEEQTRADDRTKATALLRAAVDGATADLQRKPTQRTRALRAVAAYQLATLLLQESATVKEGDALVWRLGFRLRLADGALRYGGPATPRAGRRQAAAPRCVGVLDGALGAANRAAAARIFGAGAPYWDAEAGGGFHSHSVPLDDASPLGALLRAMQPAVVAAAPAAAAARTCEVWAHARENDGAHQLHYDLDERALRSSGETRSPLVSSVYYLETIGDGGAPTMVFERRLGDTTGAEVAAWLCAPAIDRLFAFDGSLLHCVVPPRVAPPASPGARRVTIMVGWWGPNVTVGPADEPGPCRAPGAHRDAWLPEAAEFVAPPPTAAVSDPPRLTAAWRRVKGPAAAFGDLVSPEVVHAGRFFLRDDPSEIDRNVLEATPKPVAAVEYVDLASLLAAPSPAPAKKKRRRK